REIDGIAVASPPDAIPLAEPPYFVCTVPAVTGKVEEVVASATIAFPDPSTAMAAALYLDCRRHRGRPNKGCLLRSPKRNSKATEETASTRHLPLSLAHDSPPRA